jgi:hypothetical protein
MTKRYSGDLTIHVVYDDRNHYKTSVSRKGKNLWSGTVRPAIVGFGPGIAYDSPKAYDEIAATALAFADNDVGGVRDSAEYNENLSDVLIRRSPGRKPSHARKRSPAQLQRDIEAVVGKPKHRR